MIGRSSPINATSAKIKTFTAMFDSLRGSFNGTFDKLDAHLASQ